MNKIHLYLLGKKGLESLKALSQDEIKLIANVTIGRDKNVMNDYSEEIVNYCKKNGINYFNNNKDSNLKSNYLVAIGWRWLVPKSNSQTLIILHDSLLPKYRGFNPLVTSLINGDNKIGVTALFGEKNFDTGDIIKQWKKEIDYPIKIYQAIDIIIEGYKTLFKFIMSNISTNKDIRGTPQDNSKVTYSVWRDYQDYFINWKDTSNKIKRFVDAVGFPYLGARTYLESEEIKINEIEIFDNKPVENKGFGKVLMLRDNKPIVICSDGLMKINKMTKLDGTPINKISKLKMRFNNV